MILPILFFILLLLAVAADRLPVAVPVFYLMMSSLGFIAYARDKAAARRKGRRIRESTLHLLALAGGWPAAGLAQEVLRHKTVKPGFRRMYWLIVIVHCTVALAAGWLLLGPGGAQR